MLKTSVMNSKGEPIVLNAQETARALALQSQYNREIRNSLGADISITTLTAISKSIIEQKFFTLPPFEYVPMVVGEGAFSDQILTYRSYDIGGDFETGNVNTAASNTRLAEADAGVDSVTNPIVDWAKQINWSFIDLRKAARAGNWNLIAEKERARKKNWDLGIQKIAFLGSASNSNVLGLLTQTGVNSNTALITGYVSAMSATNFGIFVQGVIGAYRLNCNYTAMPTHFVMPEQDFDGLINLVPGTVGTYPINRFDYLLTAFKQATGNANFQIKRCAYADQANNSAVAGLNKNRYALYNYDQDSLRMDIPVDYTNTLQNTINGFNFQNVGYGEYTGALAYRPLEMLYFDWNS